MTSPEWRRAYHNSYYHKRKQELMNLLGNKCAICGSTEELEFDHKDAQTKKFPISSLLSHSWAVVLSEVAKCQLLCKRCHLEKSKKDISIKNSGSRNAFYNKHGAQHPSSKPCIDLDTGREYESATEFAKAFGLNVNNVTRVCRGETKSVHGHRLRYK